MDYSKSEIIQMLGSSGSRMQELLNTACSVKNSTIGDGVYLRGLIEYTNRCRKSCLYCGIRSARVQIERYTLTREQVIDAAWQAYDSGYGSVVLQGGEICTPEHITTIEELVREIKHLSNNKLGVTLSLGEQTPQTYERWFEAGAHRYLLRVESSSRQIYERIHPANELHSFDRRLRALHDLKDAGYQVGTGVMIGIPGQSVEDLVNDLIFMRDFDIDMCGMGPFIECQDTPMAESGAEWTLEQRFDMTLKMIATLRLLMPDINIAATTALQAIDPAGRIRAIESGANIIMPNITPRTLRANYSLYDNKPTDFDSKVIEDRVRYGEWGDSHHFIGKKRKKN